MDKDGKFKLSKVINVKLTGRKTLVENVYPTYVKTNMLITADVIFKKTQPVPLMGSHNFLYLIKGGLPVSIGSPACMAQHLHLF
jgi:hypothetical protein